MYILDVEMFHARANTRLISARLSANAFASYVQPVEKHLTTPQANPVSFFGGN